MQNNMAVILLLFFIMPLLSACDNGQSVDEIKNHMSNFEKTLANNPKKPIPPIPTVLPMLYQPKNVRSPFEVSMATTLGSQTNPLLSYPVSVLVFKGTLVKNRTTWGFLLAPDNKLYRVKLGDIIGDHYGRITKISRDKIEVEEQMAETAGIAIHTSKRIMTLQLKD